MQFLVNSEALKTPVLTYVVLSILKQKPTYPYDVINQLHQLQMHVETSTVYKILESCERQKFVVSTWLPKEKALVEIKKKSAQLFHHGKYLPSKSKRVILKYYRIRRRKEFTITKAGLAYLEEFNKASAAITKNSRRNHNET
jgi:DNA-binding PadR family transcriptional regulator